MSANLEDHIALKKTDGPCTIGIGFAIGDDGVWPLSYGGPHGFRNTLYTVKDPEHDFP